MHLEQFADLLACPDCLVPVTRQAGGLLCPRCGVSFPIRQGRPIMFPGAGKSEDLRRVLESAEGQRMQEEYQATGATSPESPRGAGKGLKAFWQRYKEPVYRYPAGLLDRMYRSRGEATRILSLGGGPSRNNEKELNLNIGLFPNVDLVADAHHLPFLSDSVDGIFCNAVLEHVRDSERIARECLRVVRPGGYVYIMMPFIFTYHSYPADYRRLTLTGLEESFAGFHKIDAGTCVGPTYALVHLGEQYLRNFLPSLAPVLPRWLLRLVYNLYALCFYPLKHLDRLLSDKPLSHWQAAILYYLGQKENAECGMRNAE